MKPYYNGHSTKAGVYKIVNTIDGKFYLGSTYSFYKRCPSHRSNLNKGLHHCRHLQNAWNKYGEDAFEFHILEVTEVKKRTEVEQKYLDEHFGKPYCYNSSPRAQKHARDTRPKHILKEIYGREKSKEERDKISKGQQGNTNGSKKRNYDPRLAEAKRQFLADGTPEHISFEKDEQQFLKTEAKRIYQQWPRYVNDNPQLTAIRVEQRKLFKQWLVEQDLWYDARSDSWDRKSEENKIAAIEILKSNQHKSPIFQKQFKRY